MAARVLAQDDARSILAQDADERGVDDLVRGLVLEHAVLVDAALVRKRVGAHDGLVRLDGHAGVVHHHAGRGHDVLQGQARVKPTHVVLATEIKRDGHLLEGRVARALADAVDGALNLPRARHRARQTVARGQPEVVLAVRGQDHVLHAHSVCLNARDQGPKLVGDRDAHRIGNVKRCRASLDHLPEDPVQELRIRSPGVFRAELHIITPQAPAVLHRLYSKRHNLIRRLL
mmetsp:Transcript_39877/g.66886  ORF Transcript_39877/g.66886 Transcript_39877/m.66886 type:complete len:231 (-) Transcript_39877:840-1532(-)